VGLAETDGLERALGWLIQLWGAGESHLPLALVHDLGHLLANGRAVRFASGQRLAQWPANEQAERLHYEDAVLGQWLRDPSLDAAHLAVSGLAEAHQDAAIAHGIGLVLAEPLRDAEIWEGNAAFLRSVRGLVLEQRAEPLDPDWQAFTRKQRANALAHLPTGRLFEPADIWEMAHFAAVPSESLRLALRQLHARRDGVPLPGAGLLGQVKQRARQVPVESDEADIFPAGGFDGISQRGRFENLVRTEIGYVDTEVLPGVADAFDIRYVLGELLYYTRDESPLYDAHREVTVRIDHLSRLRDKHADLPVQTAVLVQALALALFRDLVAVFGRAAAAVHLRLTLSDAEDLAVVDEDLGLIRTSMAGAIGQGRFSVESVEVGESLPAPMVVFSPLAAPADPGRRTVWIRLNGADWGVTRPDGVSETVDMRSVEGARLCLDHVLLGAFAPGKAR
jgi:hypothetical protein